MAANTDPIFALTPILPPVQISAANTNRDGTGTIVIVATGGTNGTRIDKIDIVATGTTTAGIVRLYIDDGTNVRLWKEILVTAITPSTTIVVFSSVVLPDNALEGPLLILPSTYELQASTHNAETFNVIAHGGDF